MSSCILADWTLNTLPKPVYTEACISLVIIPLQRMPVSPVNAEKKLHHHFFGGGGGGMLKTLMTVSICHQKHPDY